VIAQVFNQLHKNKNNTVGEQNSLGGGKINLPEFSKENISKYTVCSPKKGVFTRISPFFSLKISMISIKKGLHQKLQPIFKDDSSIARA